MANNVIEEASGKVGENKKHMGESWGEEVAGGYHISDAWFQSEISVTMELITEQLGGKL